MGGSVLVFRAGRDFIGTKAVVQRITRKAMMLWPHISRQALNRIGIIATVWTGYGLLMAWQAHYWYAFTPYAWSWAKCLRSEVPFAWLWGLSTPVILWCARKFRLEGPHWGRHLLIHASLLLVLSPVIKIIYDWICPEPNSMFNHFTWVKMFRSVEMTLDTATLLYAVVVGVEHAFVYYQRYQTGIAKSARLQTQLVQAQLQALKMQLHPHFLFNTLHSITALVHEDPEMAERTIARLSELLRLFMANSTIHEVPLTEELRILELYLEIEKARFEDRLRVIYDVPPVLRDAMVPNLVLQPLVENSIRHGVGRRSEPGWISIAAERYSDTLVLRVTDNGAGFEAAEPVHQGMGLGITRGRLESLYGGEQSLEIRNLPAGGVEARITMPFRTLASLPERGVYAEL
jgi:two-component system LytT family sensor kinase